MPSPQRPRSRYADRADPRVVMWQNACAVGHVPGGGGGGVQLVAGPRGPPVGPNVQMLARAQGQQVMVIPSRRHADINFDGIVYGNQFAN